MKILTGFYLEGLRPEPHNWYRLHGLCANLFHVARVFPELEIHSYLTYGAYNECRIYARRFDKEFDFIGPNVYIHQLPEEYEKNYAFFYDNIRHYLMMRADDDCLILDADMNLYLDSRNWLLNLDVKDTKYWCENYWENHEEIQRICQAKTTWDAGILDYVVSKYNLNWNKKVSLGPSCLAVFSKNTANELGRVTLDAWNYVDQHRKLTGYRDEDLSSQFAEIASCCVEAVYFLAKGGTINNIDSTYYTHAQGALPRFPGELQDRYDDSHLFQSDLDLRVKCYERYWEALMTSNKPYYQQEALDLFLELNQNLLEIKNEN